MLPSGLHRRGSPLGDIVAHPTFILLLLLLPRRDKGIGPRHTANVVFYPRRRPPRPSRANLAPLGARKEAGKLPIHAPASSGAGRKSTRKGKSIRPRSPCSIAILPVRCKEKQLRPGREGHIP